MAKPCRHTLCMASGSDAAGRKYTRARRPVTLYYYETWETKSEAMHREWAIKQLNHQEKAALGVGFTADRKD